MADETPKRAHQPAKTAHVAGSDRIGRRALLTGGALAAVGAAAACSGAEPSAGANAGGAAGPSAPAISRQRVRLTCVTTWPPDFPGLGTAAERLAQKAAALSDGDLTIQIYADGEIVPAFEAFDAVSAGSADLYHGVEYYWQGKAKAFNFFGGVPMGLAAHEFSAWLEFGGGQALWDELSASFNIKPFMAGNTGHQMGGWFKRPINSLDDFAGLKMRIPGLGGEVVRGLGGAAVSMSGGEIFPSLQSGAIDATEWVGPWNDRIFGFQTIAKHYYGPGFHEPGTALSVGVNLGVWEGLSGEHQAIIEEACRAATHTAIAEFAHNNAIALKALVEDDGVILAPFPADVWREAARISEDVVAAAGEESDLARRVYDSYRAARGTLSGWTNAAEAAYLRLRQQALAGGR